MQPLPPPPTPSRFIVRRTFHRRDNSPLTRQTPVGSTRYSFIKSYIVLRDPSWWRRFSGLSVDEFARPGYIRGCSMIRVSKTRGPYAPEVGIDLTTSPSAFVNNIYSCPVVSANNRISFIVNYNQIIIIMVWWFIERIQVNFIFGITMQEEVHTI